MAQEKAKPDNVVALANYRRSKAPTPPPKPQLEWHIDVAEGILHWANRRPDLMVLLNERELDFVYNMAVLPYPPSERQEWWLEDIENKLVRALQTTPNPPAA